MTFGTESDKLREVTGLQSTVLRRHGAKITQLLTNTAATDYFTVLLNSDQEKKKLLHPKSIPTSQCYYCTLIFNNFEMFRMKTFEIKPQTGGVNA